MSPGKKSNSKLSPSCILSLICNEEFGLTKRCAVKSYDFSFLEDKFKTIIEMCHIYIGTCRHTSVFSLKTPHMLSQLTFNGCNFHSYATGPSHTWPQCSSLSKENQLCDSDYFIFQMVQTASEHPSFGFSELKEQSSNTRPRSPREGQSSVRPTPHIHLLS